MFLLLFLLKYFPHFSHLEFNCAITLKIYLKLYRISGIKLYINIAYKNLQIYCEETRRN